MSLPEISRRCLSCGAAVRSGARFCPQCGQMMEAGPGAGAEGAQTGESQPRGGAAFAEWDGAARPESAGRVPDAADVQAILDSEPEREWAPPTKEFSVFVGSSEDGAVSSPEDGAPSVEARDVEVPVVELPASERRDVEVPAVETPDVGVDAAAGASADEARGRVARVREGARERVGRMKDEARVVLEEAPDDSGLRFVLTAAALFVVFLVILLLSTTVLR
jgi:hypothetical protein